MVSAMNDADLNASKLAAVARGIYAEERHLLMRALQIYRPYVSPLAEVIREIPERSRVLDVGCGAGLLLLLLAKLDRIDSGFGFDVSTAAAKIAQAAALRMPHARSVTFEERPIDAGIPRGDWNVITLVDVLHHVAPSAQRTLVVELANLVPKGGRLIIKDMVTEPRWRAMANKLHDFVIARQLVHHVHQSAVQQWGAEQGLETVRQTQINTLWYGHWMLVFDRPT